jgi:hypothetical protein
MTSNNGRHFEGGFTIYDTQEETIAERYMLALKAYRKGFFSSEAEGLAKIRETAARAGISEEKMQTDIAAAKARREARAREGTEPEEMSP